MEENLYSISARCYLDQCCGTVRYVGEVPPTEGLWYGVEWDQKRGKHNGTYNGVKYFSCEEGYGSFVRPHKIKFGISANEALDQVYGIGKYVELEPIVLNEETNSETKIEMVGFDKVASQQSNYENLKDVDLSKAGISHANPELGFNLVLPKITSLDLSENLFSSLQDIFDVASKMKSLKVLNISKNIISNFVLHEVEEIGSFIQVSTLYVNQMRLTWEQLLQILYMVPAAIEIHACLNQISDVKYGTRLENIEILNLEGNQISDWNSVLCLSRIKQLKRLILNENTIERVQFAKDPGFALLTSISLYKNLVNEWNSVNELNKLKSLREVRFSFNPVCEVMTGFELRQELVARLPNVCIINGSEVEITERKLAEIAYLKKYSSCYFKALNDSESMHILEQNQPHYLRLISIYGPPANEKKISTSLKDNLLALEVFCPDCNEKKNFQKQVPGTITIQQLKGILQRYYKVPNVQQKLSYLDIKNNREILLDDNMKQLTYYSVTSGDKILLRW